MPKVAAPLSALAISKLRHSVPGSERNELIAVGHVPGLCLQIGPPDASGHSSKSWICRAVIGRRRRWAGLGGYPGITLAMAIDAARQLRQAVRDGTDPIEQRRVARVALIAEQSRAMTVQEAVTRFLPIRLAKIGKEKSRYRWQSTVEKYVIPIIGSMHVNEVTKTDVLRVLQQPHTNERTGAKGELWTNIPESAGTLRQRIEEILDWTISNNFRPGPNPAAWSGNLEYDLPIKSSIVADQSHPALSVVDAPAWFAALRQRGGNGALALQLLAMTAVRSGNVRNMRWAQIDFDARTWTIAAADMKQSDNGEHIVPLPDAAIALLQGMPRTSDLVFPASNGSPLSDMALSMLMRKMSAARPGGWIDRQSGRPAVPHGLRSTFSTWANDHAEYEPDMIEFALAHKVGTDVAQRYRRGSMIDKRRALMTDWTTFLLTRNSESITT